MPSNIYTLIEENKLDEIKQLLADASEEEKNALVNPEKQLLGRSPLAHACCFGSEEIVQFLVVMGASIVHNEIGTRKSILDYIVNFKNLCPVIFKITCNYLQPYIDDLATSDKVLLANLSDVDKTKIGLMAYACLDYYYGHANKEDRTKYFKLAFFITTTINVKPSPKTAPIDLMKAQAVLTWRLFNHQILNKQFDSVKKNFHIAKDKFARTIQLIKDTNNQHDLANNQYFETEMNLDSLLRFACAEQEDLDELKDPTIIEDVLNMYMTSALQLGNNLLASFEKLFLLTRQLIGVINHKSLFRITSQVLKLMEEHEKTLPELDKQKIYVVFLQSFSIIGLKESQTDDLSYCSDYLSLSNKYIELLNASSKAESIDLSAEQVTDIKAANDDYIQKLKRYSKLRSGIKQDECTSWTENTDYKGLIGFLRKAEPVFNDFPNVNLVHFKSMAPFIKSYFQYDLKQDVVVIDNVILNGDFPKAKLKELLEAVRLFSLKQVSSDVENLKAIRAAILETAKQMIGITNPKKITIDEFADATLQLITNLLSCEVRLLKYYSADHHVKLAIGSFELLNHLTRKIKSDNTLVKDYNGLINRILAAYKKCREQFDSEFKQIHFNYDTLSNFGMLAAFNKDYKLLEDLWRKENFAAAKAISGTYPSDSRNFLINLNMVFRDNIIFGEYDDASDRILNGLLHACNHALAEFTEIHKSHTNLTIEYINLFWATQSLLFAKHGQYFYGMKYGIAAHDMMRTHAPKNHDVHIMDLRNIKKMVEPIINKLINTDLSDQEKIKPHIEIILEYLDRLLSKKLLDEFKEIIEIIHPHTQMLKKLNYLDMISDRILITIKKHKIPVSQKKVKLALEICDQAKGTNLNRENLSTLATDELKQKDDLVVVETKVEPIIIKTPEPETHHTSIVAANNNNASMNSIIDGTAKQNKKNKQPKASKSEQTIQKTTKGYRQSAFFAPKTLRERNYKIWVDKIFEYAASSQETICCIPWREWGIVKEDEFHEKLPFLKAIYQRLIEQKRSESKVLNVCGLEGLEDLVDHDNNNQSNKSVEITMQDTPKKEGIHILGSTSLETLLLESVDLRSSDLDGACVNKIKVSALEFKEALNFYKQVFQAHIRNLENQLHQLDAQLQKIQQQIQLGLSFLENLNTTNMAQTQAHESLSALLDAKIASNQTKTTEAQILLQNLHQQRDQLDSALQDPRLKTATGIQYQDQLRVVKNQIGAQRAVLNILDTHQKNLALAASIPQLQTSYDQLMGTYQTQVAKIKRCRAVYTANNMKLRKKGQDDKASLTIKFPSLTAIDLVFIAEHDFENNLKSRDYTISGITLCGNYIFAANKEALLDFCRGKIKCIGNPFDNFSYDFVRKIRGLRLFVKLRAAKFTFDEETLKQLKNDETSFLNNRKRGNSVDNLFKLHEQLQKLIQLCGTKDSVDYLIEYNLMTQIQVEAKDLPEIFTFIPCETRNPEIKQLMNNHINPILESLKASHYDIKQWLADEMHEQQLKNWLAYEIDHDLSDERFAEYREASEQLAAALLIAQVDLKLYLSLSQKQTVSVSPSTTHSR